MRLLQFGKKQKNAKNKNSWRFLIGAGDKNRTCNHELFIKRRLIRLKKWGLYPDFTPLSPILRRVPICR